MERRNHFCIFLSLAVNCENKLLKNYFFPNLYLQKFTSLNFYYQHEPWIVFLHQEECPHQIFIPLQNNISQFDYELWLKNKMSLKVLLVIGNGFLIPTWKYWIWISKNESILRTTAWKSVDYSSIQNCVWACHLVSVRKIPTSLMDKCKRMT